MRSLRTIVGGIAAAAILAASPANAQSAALPSVNQSVAETLFYHMTAEGKTMAETNQHMAAMTNILMGDMTAIQPTCGNGNSCGWLPFIVQKLTQGLQLGSGVRSDPNNRFTAEDCIPGPPPYCGGSGGGGGAGASWTNAGNVGCNSFKYHLDQMGRLYIPTMTLRPGQAFVKADASKLKAVHLPAHIADNDTYTTKDDESAALWTMHNLNKAVYPKPVWMGAWGEHSLNGFLMIDHCQPREYVGGLLQGGPCASIGIFSVDPAYGGANTTDCPPNGSAGGAGFDFYGDNYNGNNPFRCIMYAPNPQIGKGGYAMPYETVIPYDAMHDFPAQLGGWVKACQLNPEVIRQIVQKLLDEHTAQTGVLHTPVTTGEVRNGCGGDPQLADLSQAPALPAHGTCSTAPSPQTTDPPPTSTGGTGSSGCMFTAGCDDPGVATTDPTAPTVSSIMDPIANWFPSIPTLSLDVSGAACPTWQATVFNWQLNMTSQCTLAEQSRAAISALMLAVWTIAAATIILRA